MQVLGVKFTVKELIITGVASAVLLYGIKKIAFAIEPELEKKLDVTDKDNIVSSWFTDTYQKVTGSDQMLGADIFDWLHPKKTGVDDSLIIAANNTGDYDADYGNPNDGLTDTEIANNTFQVDQNW